jgi:hypothetical protein
MFFSQELGKQLINAVFVIISHPTAYGERRQRGAASAFAPQQRTYILATTVTVILTRSDKHARS